MRDAELPGADLGPAGARARVRFVTDSKDVTVLRTYADKSCGSGETEWLRLRDGAQVNGSAKRLDMPLWNNYNANAAKEVFVETGKPVNGMFYGSERTAAALYTCGVPFFFTFDDRKDYEVRHSVNLRTCRVVVAELVGGPQGVVARDVAAFDNRATPENRGCIAAFNKPRLF